MSTLKLMPPSWKQIENITYLVKNSDKFKFGSSTRPPLTSEYRFTINFLGHADQGEILNLEFPDGVWPAVRHQQGISTIREILNTIDNWNPFSCSIFYSRKESSCDWLDWESTEENLQTYFEESLNQLDPFTAKRFQGELLDFIELLKDFLLSDVKRIFDYFGIEYRTDDVLHIYEDDQEKIERRVEKVASLLEAMEDDIDEDELEEARQQLVKLQSEKSARERHTAVCYSQVENEYTVNMLKGANSIAKNVNHDFSKIMDLFQTGELDLEDYKNITLVQKKVTIEKHKNILNDYFMNWRTDSKDMLKEKTVTISSI